MVIGSSGSVQQEANTASLPWVLRDLPRPDAPSGIPELLLSARTVNPLSRTGAGLATTRQGRSDANAQNALHRPHALRPACNTTVLNSAEKRVRPQAAVGRSYLRCFWHRGNTSRRNRAATLRVGRWCCHRPPKPEATRSTRFRGARARNRDPGSLARRIPVPSSESRAKLDAHARNRQTDAETEPSSTLRPLNPPRRGRQTQSDRCSNDTGAHGPTAQRLRNSTTLS